MVVLTGAPIDVAAVFDAVRDDACGAITGFVGVVRGDEVAGDRVVALEYEAHAAMAVGAMRRIGEEAARPGPLRWAIHHRTGRVAAGEVSVVVAIATPHRAEAFAACRIVVDRLKREVPIWKRLHFSSGRAAWAEGNPLA